MSISEQAHQALLDFQEERRLKKLARMQKEPEQASLNDMLKLQSSIAEVNVDEERTDGKATRVDNVWRFVIR
jgi:hypothetical protein